LYTSLNAKLSNHDTTIAYFYDALHDRSQWPNVNAAHKQDFCGTDVPPPNHVTKTGWSTTLFTQQIDGVNDGKEVSSDNETIDEDQYEVVETSWEDVDSDQMSVDSRNPTVCPKDIIP